MKNFFYILATICILTVFTFSGCTGNTSPSDIQALEGEIPVEIKDFYIDFLEKAKTDRYTAVYSYCHFESSERMEMTASAPNLTKYEIVGWKKLSDELWEVEVVLTDEIFPSGCHGVNYVGIIDRNYHVMTGINQIPPTLKEGVQIEPLSPSGNEIVNQDEIIDSILPSK